MGMEEAIWALNESKKMGIGFLPKDMVSFDAIQRDNGVFLIYKKVPDTIVGGETVLEISHIRFIMNENHRPVNPYDGVLIKDLKRTEFTDAEAEISVPEDLFQQAKRYYFAAIPLGPNDVYNANSMGKDVNTSYIDYGSPNVTITVELSSNKYPENRIENGLLVRDENDMPVEGDSTDVVKGSTITLIDKTNNKTYTGEYDRTPLKFVIPKDSSYSITTTSIEYFNTPNEVESTAGEDKKHTLTYMAKTMNQCSWNELSTICNSYVEYKPYPEATSTLKEWLYRWLFDIGDRKTFKSKIMSGGKYKTVNAIYVDKKYPTFMLDGDISGIAFKQSFAPIGGYYTSTLRTVINNPDNQTSPMFYFPQDLLDVLKKRPRTYLKNEGPNTPYTLSDPAEDFIFIPTLHELGDPGDANNVSGNLTDVYEGEYTLNTSQQSFPYFVNDESRKMGCVYYTSSLKYLGEYLYGINEDGKGIPPDTTIGWHIIPAFYL